MKNKVLLLLLAPILLSACSQVDTKHESFLPAEPSYDRISCCKTFQLDGMDTIWGETEYYKYDNRGRYLSVETFDVSGCLERLITFAYGGCTDTMCVYDAGHRLQRKLIHTYPDSAFLPEPPFEGPFYQHVMRSEIYDMSGTLISLTNNKFDDRLRVTQTDGFDVNDGILYSASVYYEFGADYTIVHNPKTENETVQQGSRTYADTLCRYPLTHLRELSRGKYEERYTYDSLGRRSSYVGNYAGVTVDSIEYMYFPDGIHEIDYENSLHKVRYYYQ